MKNSWILLLNGVINILIGTSISRYYVDETIFILDYCVFCVDILRGMYESNLDVLIDNPSSIVIEHIHWSLDFNVIVVIYIFPMS